MQDEKLHFYRDCSSRDRFWTSQHIVEIKFVFLNFKLLFSNKISFSMDVAGSQQNRKIFNLVHLEATEQ